MTNKKQCVLTVEYPTCSLEMEQSSGELGVVVTSTPSGPSGATPIFGWLGNDVWDCSCITRHHKTCVVQLKIDALIAVHGVELGKRKWAAMRQQRRRKRLRPPKHEKSEDAASALLVLSAGAANAVDSRFAHGGDRGSGALPSSKQMRGSSSSSPTAASFSTSLPSCPEAQDRERIQSVLKMLTAEELREVLNQSLNDPRALAAMAILFPSEKYL